MGDSNPRSGDWDNTMHGIYVAGGGIIVLAFLIALAVTGHAVAAFWIGIVLCFGALTVRALLARDRD